LSNTVFLWACRISQKFIADGGYSEEGLLGQTVAAIAGDAMSIDSWHRALQIMQADVLLSLYYMETGRLLEGSHYCAAATSLAFSTGLHQLGYPSYTGPLPQEFLRVSLAAVADNARQRRLNAFWSVVILNNYWVAVSGVPSSIHSGTTINSAWPLVSSVHHSTGSSMFNFLSQYHHVTNLHSTAGSTSNYASGNSPLALLADASNLLQHAIAFNALYQGTHGDLHPGTDLHHPAEFWALDHRVETFRNSLSSITGGCGPTGLITHIFVHAAILQLHYPHTIASIVSHAKCLSAGSGVAACLTDTRLGDWEHADPVLG
ncbi:hypothetical protein GGX14DRAFT_338983, partial [Mycena pura]